MSEHAAETAPGLPGFEVGPIRPPSEANSLLLRLTRNCPWNRCTFCPVYKGERFSLRTVEEIEADIAAMARAAARLREISHEQGEGGEISYPVIHALLQESRCREMLQVALFVAAGARTAFLQDANSLIMKVDDLERVLLALRAAFPTVTRVTTYARAHTVRLRTVDELRRLGAAGLNRIHIGLESGSDRVLAQVQKGITAERQIQAGRLVKEAGLELSEYVMPGLGGRALSEDHARETARVLRAIDPHFVRLRSLALPQGAPITEQVVRGELEPLDDLGVARELRLMFSEMTDMTSAVRSDHVLNLLEELEGQLPEDLPRLLGTIDRFLALPSDDQDLFIVGRRAGILHSLDELDVPEARTRAAETLAALRARFDGPLSEVIRTLTMRFV